MFILFTKLSGFGSAITIGGATQQSLATTLTVDLRPAAGKSRLVSSMVATPNTAGAAGVLGTTDGVTLTGRVTVGVNGSGADTMVGGNSNFGALIDNTGTQTDTYSYSFCDLGT